MVRVVKMNRWLWCWVRWMRDLSTFDRVRINCVSRKMIGGRILPLCGMSDMGSVGWRNKVGEDGL
jgi:hypothetical protein